MQEQITEYWDKYQKGVKYLEEKNLYTDTNYNWNMYLGNQWVNLESGDEVLPIANIIKGIVKYKVGVVSQNTMTAVYKDMEGNANPTLLDLLNKNFAKSWEKGKMDTVAWNVIKAAAIQGDSYLYYGTGETTKPQILSNVQVLLGNEQEQDIQKQPYIIISERLMVDDVRAKASKNGIAEEDITKIIADADTDKLIGNKLEVKTDDGKCSVITYMFKDEAGIVHIIKSTYNVIYQKDTKLSQTDYEGNDVGVGLKSYPLVPFVWEQVPNDARGTSEVKYLIPNQIELNKTLARRAISVKMASFPRIVYDDTLIENAEDLTLVGAPIAFTGGYDKNIANAINYLNPAPISNDAKQLSDELLINTKELAGAGDAVQGVIDPSKASGTAIMAVQSQAEIPLNEQVASYRQFVEDLALLWFDLWVAYNPEGVRVEVEDDVYTIIPPEELQSIKADVKVDVSQDTPWSKFTQQQILDNLLQAGHITFEEYVDLLDSASNVPKARLEDILEARMQQPMLQPQGSDLDVLQNPQIDGINL